MCSLNVEVELIDLSPVKLHIIYIKYVTDHRSAFTVWGRRNGPVSGTIRFINVITDIGGHYDTPTGQFTCQYPGVYVFTLNILKNSGDNYAECYIRKNGSRQIRIHTNPESTSDGGYYETSNTVVIYLNRSDIVDLGGCSSIHSIHSGSMTSFSGYLLKAE